MTHLRCMNYSLRFRVLNPFLKLSNFFSPLRLHLLTKNSSNHHVSKESSSFLFNSFNGFVSSISNFFRIIMKGELPSFFSVWFASGIAENESFDSIWSDESIISREYTYLDDAWTTGRECILKQWVFDFSFQKPPIEHPANTAFFIFNSSNSFITESL